MREEELVDLVRKVQKRRTEFQNVELKATEKGFPKKIYDTLSSFSNQDEGGVIIFGVAEDKDFAVVGVYDIRDAQKKAMEACNQMEPKVRAVFTNCEIDGKYVLSAEIPSVEYYDRPVYYSGAGRIRGSYVRVGDADEPMSEYEVYSYEAFRRRVREELKPVPEARIELFNQEKIEEFIRAVKEERPNLAKNVDDKDILELMGITIKGVPTIAGVMCFGIYPQVWFPQLCITAVRVPGMEKGDLDSDGARFLDNKRITGSIPDMADGAVEFVRKNSRVKTIIDKDGKRSDKTEYPLRAVREAVLNTLIHRDYSAFSENTPVGIEMYQDRIEFISKGGLYGGGSVRQLGKGRPDTRNPVIANIMELMHITENRYSGIPTMKKELKEAGLPAPVFTVSRGVFTVVFHNELKEEEEIIDKTDLRKAIIQFCKVPRSREELTDFTGKSRYYTMSAYVTPMVESGELMLTIPDKPKSPKQKYVSVEN